MQTPAAILEASIHTPSSAYDAVVSGPAFALGLRCTADEVTLIEFLTPRPDVSARSPLAIETARQLRAYLADPAFEFGLPLQTQGTLFQRRVWAGIARIPSGKTRTYGEVAADIHSGPRAVGGACGANPYPVVVPCHRVVAANGLGGFARNGGDFLLDVKRWLLAHEAA